MSSLQQMSYMGSSMNPVLRAGDVLEVVPYRGRKIRVGDVVVFSAPDAQPRVVHRVVELDSGAVRTRGDNNPEIDDCELRAAGILGRVASLIRDKKVITVHGGRRGVLHAAVLRILRQFNRAVSRALHPTYYRLSRARVFGTILSPWIETSMVGFKRPGGTETQLLLGRCVIGRRLSDRESGPVSLRNCNLA